MQLAMTGLGRMGGNMARRVTEIAIQFRQPPHLMFPLAAEQSIPPKLSYATGFGPSGHSAYETLLLDCMLGDTTLFARSDGVEAAWRVVDPLIEAWEQRGPEDPSFYPAGEWGPAKADELITHDGASWRTP